MIVADQATWICLALLVGSLVVTRLLCRGMLFNPLVAFFGVWMLHLAMYELDSITGFFYVRLSEYAGFLLSTSFVFFFLGALIGVLGIRWSDDAKEDRQIVVEGQVRALSRLTTLLFLVFIGGVSWKYWIAVSMYGPLLENIASTRAGFWSGEAAFPLLGRAMALSGYIVVLNLGILFAVQRRFKVLLLIIVTVLLYWVNDLTVGMRGSTFNAVLLSVSVVFLTVGAREGKTGVAQVFAAGCAMLAGITLITTILYLRSDGTLSFIDRLLVDNYMYFVGTIPATSYFIDNPWPTSLPGQWTFVGVYQIIDTVFGKALGVTLVPDDFSTYYAAITDLGPFNSAGYLAVFYSDLREPGVLVFSALMGFFGAYTFMKAMRRRRVVDIQVAGVLMALVIFSIRGTATSGMPFWLVLAFVLIQPTLLRLLGGVEVRPSPAEI